MSIVRRYFRVVLITIVALELAVGIFVVNKYQHSKNGGKYLGVTSKENVNFPEKKTILKDGEELFDFSYYFEWKPGEHFKETAGWLDEDVFYTINKDGLNDRFDYSFEKPEEVIRIVALGDSFTFGTNVNTKDSWPEQLEVELNQSRCSIEVINLGIGGADIPYIVKRYEDFGKKYSPDYIFWYESNSGFSRISEKLHQYTEGCQNQYQSGGDLENLDNEKINTCWIDASKKIASEYDVEALRKYFRKYFDYFFENLITEEKVIYATHYGISPEDAETMNIWSSRYPGAQFLISMEPIPLEEEYRLKDMHPTVKGHEFIADAVFNILKEHPDLSERCF